MKGLCVLNRVPQLFLRVNRRNFNKKTFCQEKIYSPFIIRKRLHLSTIHNYSTAFLYNSYGINNLGLTNQNNTRFLSVFRSFSTTSSSQNPIGSSSDPPIDNSEETSSTPSSKETSSTLTPSSPSTVAIAKPSLWERIKREIKHYYHGFRLLVLDVRVASKLTFKMLFQGEELTRNERKMLVRTAADVFRMVPFVVFIVVPFMEFLLPFYLKFFPFMLPSTFKDQDEEKKKLRAILKGKLEIAKFLQNTLEENVKSQAISTQQDGMPTMAEFTNFMRQVRESGSLASTTDIIRFSHLFPSDTTLETIDHATLKAICQLLELQSIGPSTLLRFQIRMRMQQLYVDDKIVKQEGIDHLPVWDLQTLCRERGMRALGVSEDRLRQQLAQWLEMHLERRVPMILMLLTRAMYLPDSYTAEEKIKTAIRNLPEAASSEAALKVAISSGQERLENEAAFEVRRAEASRLEKEIEDLKKSSQLEKEIADQPSVVLVDKAVAMDDQKVSATDIAEIQKAMESLDTSTSTVQHEELDDLKKDIDTLSPAAGLSLGTKVKELISDIDSLLAKLSPPSSGVGGTVSINDLLISLHSNQRITNVERWSRILHSLDANGDGQIAVSHVVQLAELLESEDVNLTKLEVDKILQTLDKEARIDKLAATESASAHSAHKSSSIDNPKL